MNRVPLLLLIWAAGCTQDNAGGNNDLAVSMDLSGIPDEGVDLAGVDQATTDQAGDQAVTLGDGGADAASGDMIHLGDAAPVGVDGHVSCLGGQCSTPPEHCCWKAGTASCAIGDGLQCSLASGTPIFCDSKGSTCPSNRVCCLESGVVECRTACGGTQVCDPAASECTSGTCQPYVGSALPAGYYTCQ